MLIMTDKEHFNLNGNTNTKNCVHWADRNSQAVAIIPVLDSKVIMWCDISGTVLLGLYFFEEATPMGFVVCSVTASRYTAGRKIMSYQNCFSTK